MRNHNQDPGQLNKKYDRRRKAVAWTAGLSLFGVAAVEGTQVHPAAAAPETTRQAEQSSQSFINSFDKKLAAKVKMMRSSPYFSRPFKPHQLDKSLPADITIEYVGAPSKKYPGRYDWLAVTMKDGESVPLDASINLGTDSNKYPQIRRYEVGYAFGQQDKSGEFTPKTMQLVTDGGTDSTLSPVYYEVSSEGHTINLLSGKPRYYSSDRAEVSAAYNEFLNQVQSIVTRK